MNLEFKLKKFDQLLLKELYEIMKLRQSVFIVEQHCPYNDCDDKDYFSLHLMGYTSDGVLAAYSRIVQPGISYDEVSIGRVITSVNYRTRGFGKLLVTEALKVINQTYGKVDVRIGAQSYLLKFYSAFGFEKGEAYIEDGIPHHIMLRKAADAS